MQPALNPHRRACPLCLFPEDELTHAERGPCRRLQHARPRMYDRLASSVDVRQVNICHETSAWVHDGAAKLGSRVAVARAAEKAVVVQVEGWAMGCGWWGRHMCGATRRSQASGGWTWKGAAFYAANRGAPRWDWRRSIGSNNSSAGHHRTSFAGLPPRAGPACERHAAAAGCGARRYRLSAAKPTVPRTGFAKNCFCR